MIYDVARFTDAKAIAILHKQGIPTGFLSKQSPAFLEALYRYLIAHEIVYVAKNKEKVIGFIAVSVNTSGLYKRFLKSNILLLVKFALQNIFSVAVIKKAYETLRAPKKTRIKEMQEELPELLSIVVDSDYAGKGIGKELLTCAEKELVSLQKDKYKVLVGANLEANQFYVKNGFEIVKELELHEGVKSYIYVKNLNGEHK